MIVSPDGRHLYASGGSSVTVYWRDETTGSLTLVETQGFSGPVAISPDGRHLYGAANGINTFSRDDITGELTFLEQVDGAASLTVAAVSPDGRHLYALSSTGLRGYARDEVTGLLTLVAVLTDLTGESLNLTPASIAISPEGTRVFIGIEAALVVYTRNVSTGELTLLERLFTGNLPLDGVDGPRVLIPSADGRHLYVASESDESLGVFRTPVLFQDGFESDSTSAWSLTNK